MIEYVECIICGGKEVKPLFSKESGDGEPYNLVMCRKCGLEFVSPRPTADDIDRYYNLNYFTKRTDRGYNNYFSPELRNEIERLIKLNLEDLDFYKFENNLNRDRRSLDIGCAAGYFVSFLKSRGWDSTGIDVSADCVDFAERSGINVIKGDYLEIDVTRKLDLITLWATIEHLHYPDKFLAKIFNELTVNGMLFISTCRIGGINFKNFFGREWRYYNFPEHLYFFSYPALKKILEKNGFKIVKYVTYGSGIGKAGSYKRKLADILAKWLYMGDMMLISAKKDSNRPILSD